jgi:broad specificity phosphatase PhoE
MTTWLYLLRHGATRLNLEKPYRLQGSEVDEPLAPIGFDQAAAARDLLRPVPLRAIYSSPMARAMQTAQVVAEPHALTVMPVAVLREGSVGRWENRTWEEIQVTEPEAYQQFVNDPGKVGYAGGENFEQVLQRVKPVFLELLQKHQGQSIAIVGHQIVNRTIVADLMGLPMKEARRVKFTNGGVTVISVENDQPILLSLNIAWPALPR